MQLKNRRMKIVQDDERDDNSEISDFSVTSSLESECVMCEGEQLQYRQNNTRNKEKIEILIEGSRNEIYETEYEEMPSLQGSRNDHKMSLVVAQPSTVMKRSLLFSNSTTGIFHTYDWILI